MSTHAIISPSGFKALMLCPGKPFAEKGRPDNANEFSAEGTAAHELAALLLTSPEGERQAAAYAGRIFDADGFKIEATEDFCDSVQVYVDAVFARVTEYETLFGAKVRLLVEQRVPISHLTGEAGATGTADVIMLADLPNQATILDIWDLKFGRGVVVSATDNEQLKMYALGALEEHGLLLNIITVRMNIHQPRISTEVSQCEVKVDDLLRWGENFAKPAALQSLKMYIGEVPPIYMPGESQCRFCRAKADCKALELHIAMEITEVFSDLTLENTAPACEKAPTLDAERLGRLFPQLDLIDGFLRAVRARIEEVVLSGGNVPGVKLVQGKKGNRKWSDEDAAEALCKKFRLREAEMYDMKLCSPTTLEKRLKDSPRRWKQLEDMVTRTEGKLGVAPLEDPREAVVIAPVVDTFTDSVEDLI